MLSPESKVLTPPPVFSPCPAPGFAHICSSPSGSVILGYTSSSAPGQEHLPQKCSPPTRAARHSWPLSFDLIFSIDVNACRYPCTCPGLCWAIASQIWQKWDHQAWGKMKTWSTHYWEEPQEPTCHSFIQSTNLAKHLARWGIKYDTQLQELYILEFEY